MKTLLTISIVMSSLNLNAQWYHRQFNVTNINDLNQDQLNLALKKSSNIIKSGVFLFGLGLIGIRVGNELKQYSGKQIERAFMCVPGIAVSGIGFVAILVGAERKNSIKIALTKFQPTGSINGLGLKVNF